LNKQINKQTWLTTMAIIYVLPSTSLQQVVFGPKSVRRI